MDYSIAEFWVPRLRASASATNQTPKGWQHVQTGLATFLEAPLTLNSDFGNAEPSNSGVILVSAPGAVGKSTLARQIALETGAILIDLAKAEPVGANTLVGGLARAGLYQPFLEGRAAVVVDGLDEARIHVTQEGFAAFLRDVADLASNGGKPIVLLGRTGAVQESWLTLCEHGIEAPVLEIGYYAAAQAFEFTKIQVQSFRKERRRRDADARAIQLILEQLRKSTGSDGAVFAGYSPVLIAVARQVFAHANSQELVSRIEKGEQRITLIEITQSILEREQRKFAGFDLQDQALREKLYTPEEQLLRLVGRIYHGAQLPDLPPMSVPDQDKYNKALESWLPEHPFLDGDGRKPSSAVFGGLIAAKALRIPESTEEALSAELGRGTAINPFLAEFYMSGLNAPPDGPPYVLAAHIGILYASLRARLSLGDTAQLRIDGDADGGGDLGETAEVEITRHSRSAGDCAEPYRFTTEPDGQIRFGPLVEDVDIYAPNLRISVGHGSEAVFVAPVFMEVAELSLDTDRMVAESPPHRRGLDREAESVVHLSAAKCVAPRITSRPAHHGEVTLELSWPGATAYPWTDFVVSARAEPDPQLNEALRRLKKILRLFRSHSRNQLAKYRDAIDHRRRTKGAGRCVLDQLVEEEVLTVEGAMYHLDPNRLAAVVGLNFCDVRTSGATPITVAFLNRALGRNR